MTSKVLINSTEAKLPVLEKVKPVGDIYSPKYSQIQEDEFWRKIPKFEKISSKDFLNYKWQKINSVYTENKLINIIKGIVPDDFIEAACQGFSQVPMAVRITPYLLSLIDWNDPWNDPIRKQFIPVNNQLMENHPMLSFDSLHELGNAPVPGLVHRYPQKALFLPLDTCPTYCRFCTRSYAVGNDTNMVKKANLAIDPQRWEAVFNYIESCPELEDIVISGGDTYNLSAKHIKTIGFRLLQIPHIRRIRFATKGLAVMPMKILTDEKWLDAITSVLSLGNKLYKEVALHTHFNHANEITDITLRAMKLLFERGLIVRNQTVLLRGVNDTVEQMQLLVKRLSYINIQPYYVYQHDLVQGVEDLRTSVQTAINIEKNVRGVIAGFKTPTFVLDTPGGGGKRCIHSYEYYNRETGVSVYTAPAVKPGKYFLYFDPLHSLGEGIQKDWKNPQQRQKICEEALNKAKTAYS
ncbi:MULTISPECIES: KamA family radical SAM protein [unclassified Nostoc]|uniref:KamA family radical SAM protein n=1 Tax=unclassified Nostoc TaxID=2593658 RepID=UPI002AD55276|nr:KamA family radical SAM protein [Nostoc sp. DedQUE03]MDZ7977638.1 KamA family radical SAM protein [Nostoc sp. DedQUE03]MDZ8049265.1 KamA family radical SAM protein [Nostoc sp. DedQUE02]